jgi:hypothetical protein
MTLEAYRHKVEELKDKMHHLHRLAVQTQNVGYWDAYHRTKYRWQNACSYLKKRELKEAAA